MILIPPPINALFSMIFVIASNDRLQFIMSSKNIAPPLANASFYSKNVELISIYSLISFRWRAPPFIALFNLN